MNSPSSTGSLSIFLGPMGSGKTTRAIEQVSQFCSLGYKTIYITSKLEAERTTVSQFYSHNITGASLHPLCSIFRCRVLPETFEEADVYIIDEAQFFTTLVVTVKSLLKLGKNIQVYGLSSDFKGEKFGSVIDLIPFSDSFTQMFAKCVKCAVEKRLTQASFTDRIGDSEEVIEVGGMGRYTPVCRDHHTRL